MADFMQFLSENNLNVYLLFLLLHGIEIPQQT